MARSDATAILRRAFVLWCSVVVVAALYFARVVLLPFALAILLSFLLAPLVSRLEKWRLRRIPAVLVVVALAFSAMGLLSYVLVFQMVDLAQQLPKFKGNIIAKVRSLQAGEGGVVQNVKKTIDDVRARVAHKDDDDESEESTDKTTENPDIEERMDDGLAEPESSDAKSNVQPVPVELVNEITPEQILQAVVGPIISPLSTSAMVLVFVVFMLIERENLRNRVIHLIGLRQLNTTTQALDDAASRVSRYLRMQLIVNVAFGSVVAIGLFFIEVPNALMWGALATTLRFVPYIGPWIAAAMPLLMSAAVFEGWTRPSLVLALFVANELVSNNVIEPWLYGSSTGISTMGILVSAVFWTWLWGPVGLVMATPLTVCLIVMGRYVPQLSFLETLLSDEELLPPQARFYQRLLALDSEEAADIADEYLKDHTLEMLYDNVVLPALRLAEQDRHQGDLDETKQRFILKAMRELVDDLGARFQSTDEISRSEPTDDLVSASDPADLPVVCLPARDEADEIVGVMLGQLLEARGVRTVLVSTHSLSGEMLLRVEEEEPCVICISALPPLAATHARYLCKRLRPKFSHLKTVVGLWQSPGSTKKAQARLVETGIDQVLTTLSDAASQLAQLVASQRLIVSNAPSSSV